MLRFKMCTWQCAAVVAGGTVILVLCLGANLHVGATNPASARERFRLPLRTEVQAFKGTSLWHEAGIEQDFSTHETAIVICDMWDNHWCTGAAQRVRLLAHKMEPVLEAARAAGILIIHAPSGTMDFYKDYLQRRLMQGIPRVVPPGGLGLTSPALPIDDSDEGCDTPGDMAHPVWTRENPALSIQPQDAISDDGKEIYSLLRHRGINNIFIMGVHTNMCILNRPFGIKHITNWGIPCVLVGDLTDAMYNPRSSPHVSHARGTELVIEYIEKYWCPTVLSTDLVKALKPLRPSDE